MSACRNSNSSFDHPVITVIRALYATLSKRSPLPAYAESSEPLCYHRYPQMLGDSLLIPIVNRCQYGYCSFHWSSVRCANRIQQHSAAFNSICLSRLVRSVHLQLREPQGFDCLSAERKQDSELSVMCSDPRIRGLVAIQ